MMKMIEVLDQDLVQNFINPLNIHSEYLNELINAILDSSENDFTEAIHYFHSIQNASNLADAIDINEEHLVAIQSGFALKRENLADTAKIIALYLALENNTFEQCQRVDYPNESLSLNKSV